MKNGGINWTCTSTTSQTKPATDPNGNEPCPVQSPKDELRVICLISCRCDGHEESMTR